MSSLRGRSMFCEVPSFHKKGGNSENLRCLHGMTKKPHSATPLSPCKGNTTVPKLDRNNTYRCSDNGGGIYKGQSGAWFQKKKRKQHLLLL